MLPEAERLLREVINKSMDDSDSVDRFLHSIERIRHLGDSSDIALTAMILDVIDRSIPVMQNYLNDESSIEIDEDMPVSEILRAVMTIMQMDTFLMAGQIQELSEIKENLGKVITVLHAGIG